MSTRQTRSPEEVGAEPAHTLANGKLKVFVRADLFGLLTEAERRLHLNGFRSPAFYKLVSRPLQLLLPALMGEVHQRLVLDGVPIAHRNDARDRWR